MDQTVYNKGPCWDFPTGLPVFRGRYEAFVSLLHTPRTGLPLDTSNFALQTKYGMAFPYLVSELQSKLAGEFHGGKDLTCRFADSCSDSVETVQRDRMWRNTWPWIKGSFSS